MKWKELVYLFLRALSLLFGGLVLLLFFYSRYLFLYSRYLISFIFLIITIGYALFDYHIVEKTLRKIFNPSIEASVAGQTCYEFFVGSDLTNYLSGLSKQKGSPNYKESISKFIVYTIFFWTILLIGIYLIIVINLR